jgi:hypothetical protein
MIRSIVVHEIPMNNVAAMERWYWRDHAPEICRRYGPWLTRHESYLPVDAPADARAYGMFNWRVTDGWWREIPEPGPKGVMAFSVPPVWPRVATCFITAQPDHDFKGAEIQPHERNVLRWLQLWRYPEGIDRDEADRWFTEIHAPEMCRHDGLFRFFSHRTVSPGTGLPGIWPADAVAPMRAGLLTGFHRVAELWYETFDDWRRATTGTLPGLTPPPWASQPGYPFLAPDSDFVSSFILERPNDEFLRDSRGSR